MRNLGLSNRFDGDTISVWQGWYACMWCGRNRWNAIHHIISPSSRRYKPGDFNKSLLNSSPMHNDVCHLYNPHLHNPEYERKLLKKTLEAMIILGYKLTTRDEEFIEAYKDCYDYDETLPCGGNSVCGTASDATTGCVDGGTS